MDNNNKNPLWMPKGSVRAVIGLCITIGFLGYTFMSGQVSPEVLTGIVGMVIGFYFGAKTGSEKPES